MPVDDTKLTFSLTSDQAGPFPVSTESLWCIREAGAYRIRNIPFFVDGISFDDLISVRDCTDGTVTLDQVLEASGNTTLWVYLKNLEVGAKVISAISFLGCGVESGVIKGYYSVNVPSQVSIQDVYGLLNPAKEARILIVDYPSVRHEE